MDPIVIVGGGIVGAGLAYHLRDAGREVRLLERDALGSGTTGASIAVFSWLQSDPDAFGHRLRERAWGTYGPLVEAGEIGFERIGALKTAESAAKLRELEADAERLREFGLDVESIGSDALAGFDLDPDAFAGAIHAPEEGYLDPTEIVRHWTDEAAAAGVEIETGVGVRDVRVEGGAVTGVETTDGDRAAGTVINAAGPWAARVADMAGLSVPIRHTYARILVLDPDGPVSLPYTLFENGHYVREEGGEQVFAGRLEKSYADATRYDPDATHTVEETFRTGTARTLEARAPRLAGGDVTNSWVGLRAVTPDGNPIVGPTAVDGFHHATGMSGLGITLAPAVTGALADHLAGEESAVVDRLSVSRFR